MRRRLSARMLCMVDRLCKRSASLMRMTRTSSAIANSILRKLSACWASLESKESLSNLDKPSTKFATGAPNWVASAILSTPESSITSWSNAALMDCESSFQVAHSVATASGWVMYGSPDWRYCPKCAPSAKTKATRMRAHSSADK